MYLIVVVLLQVLAFTRTSEFAKYDFHEWYIGNEHSFNSKFPLWKNKIISLFEAVSNKSKFVKEIKELAKNRFIISCHTTDLECFRRQYRALRGHLLLGNKYLGINAYRPYVFRYGDTGTCVKISGVEESELVGISMNSKLKEYSIVLEMPVRIQQIKNDSVVCARPDKEFQDLQYYSSGPMKKFSGNATVQVTYPYKLHKKKGRMYMQMDEQNLDVILDIPDLGQYDKESALEVKLYEWSEWAYEVIQHIDLAQHSLVPYTSVLNLVMEKIPLDRFILLYPDESFTHIKFAYTRPIEVE